MKQLFSDINGKFSMKRAIALILIVNGLIMTYMSYDIMYVYFILGSGLLAIGITPFEKKVSNMFKTPGNPPPEDEEETPG